MENNKDDSWTAEWVSKNLQKIGPKMKVFVISPNHLTVEHQDSFRIYNVITMALDKVEVNVIEKLLINHPYASFFINIPKDAYVFGGVYDFAEEKNVRFGDYGFLLGALQTHNPLDYQNPQIKYVTRGLVQHSAVKKFTRLDNKRFRIERKRLLKDIIIVISDDYDVSAESVRSSKEKFMDFDAVVATNPYARISPDAESVGESLKIKVFKWNEFYGELNKKWSWKKSSLW